MKLTCAEIFALRGTFATVADAKAHAAYAYTKRETYNVNGKSVLGYSVFFSASDSPSGRMFCQGFIAE